MKPPFAPFPVANRPTPLPQTVAGLMQAGRIAEAEALCRRHLTQLPKDGGAWFLLAGILTRRGDGSGALEALNTCLSLLPDHLEALQQRAFLNFKRNALDDALGDLDRVLKTHPKHISALYHRGTVLDAKGRLAEAEASFKKALKIDPKQVPIWISLSTTQKRQAKEHPKKEDDAIASCRKALALAPDDIPACNNLGNILAARGERDEARQLFEKVLTRVPDMKQTRLNLAELFFKEGDFRTARDHYLKADNPVSRARALECLVHLQDWETYDREAPDRAATEPNNLRMASISSYVADRRGTDDPFPFCPDPMGHVAIFKNLGLDEPAEPFLEALSDQLLQRDAVWEPLGSTTTKGYQTQVNLLRAAEGPAARIEPILKAAVAQYRERFAGSDCGLIRNWPEQSALDAWFVNLRKGGHQRAHNHPYGWLSGVFYLKLPTEQGPPEGSIEFDLLGSTYPALGDSPTPTKRHDPALGDLVLFPSTLFHRTIPFSSEESRLSVAFDLVPISEAPHTPS